MKIKGYAMGTIGTNCFIISDDQGITAIIDCDGSPEPVFNYVAENNLTPTHILLTHGHYDHIGAVEAIQEKYGCKVCAGKEEVRVLADPSLNCSMYSGAICSLQPDVLLGDGEVLKVGDLEFTTLFTPGHTEGSVCYMIEENIFSGDTLFEGSCGRTDLATGDWGTIVNSLKRLRDLSGDYFVYPGHGPATTLERERRSNPYM